MTRLYANSPSALAAAAACRRIAWMDAWSLPVVGLGFTEALARRRER